MASKKKSAEPNEKCPCGSGKKYKNCCGTPGQVRARRNKGRWIVPVLAVVAIGGLLAVTRSDRQPPINASPAASPAEPAPAPSSDAPSTNSAPAQGTPPAWYYDADQNRHWDPGHNHWHNGPPPQGSAPGTAGPTTGGSTPPPWYFDRERNQHWDPNHRHWHEGPPPSGAAN